jgi:hypothetical protein
MKFIAVIIVFSLWGEGVDLRADIPAGAIAAAQKKLGAYLEAREKSADYYASLGDCAFDASRCRLGAPYEIYSMGDDELAEFVASDEGVMAYARSGTYAFPVLESGGVYQTLWVVRNRDEHGERLIDGDEYIVMGGAEPNECEDEDEVEHLRRRLPRSEGWEIDWLRIFGVGTYLVVHASDGRTLLSPLNSYSAKAIGADYRSDPLVALEEAEPLLRAEAQAHLLRQRERANRPN